MAVVLLLLLLETAIESLEKSSGGTDAVDLTSSAPAPLPVDFRTTPESVLLSRLAEERCRAAAMEPATRRVDCHCGGTTFVEAAIPLSTPAPGLKSGIEREAAMTGMLYSEQSTPASQSSSTSEPRRS